MKDKRYIIYKIKNLDKKLGFKGLAQNFKLSSRSILSMLIKKDK